MAEFEAGMNSIIDKYITNRIILFVFFYVVLLGAYLVLWLPLVTKLNKDVIQKTISKFNFMIYRYGELNLCSRWFLSMLLPRLQVWRCSWRSSGTRELSKTTKIRERESERKKLWFINQFYIFIKKNSFTLLIKGDWMYIARDIKEE